MAATLDQLIGRSRGLLNEPTPKFWSNKELLDHAIAACTDLWGAYIDLHEEHFQTIDATNVSMAASSSTLTGVPSDMFRVVAIEPRDLSSSSASRNMVFVPRDYHASEFVSARSLSSQDPGSQTIYYAMTLAGPPTGTVTIEVAPQISSAVLLRLVYVATLAALTGSSTNPIPGESDTAVLAWIMAWARAKERPDTMPDPAWLAVYQTEKQSLLVRNTPRQEDEEEYVIGMFEERW